MVAAQSLCGPARPARAARTDSRRGARLFCGARFVEVDTPALQVSPGLEPHLRAFRTELHDPRGGRAAERYLHTSPEFAMKKLLVAGMPRIWQLAHVFRDGERSATHHPEFSMLEWYRVRRLLSRSDGGVRRARPRLPGGGGRRGARPGAATPPMRGVRGSGSALPTRFAKLCGIDLLATAPDPAAPDLERLAAAARHLGIDAAPRRRLGGALLPHLPRANRAPSRPRGADDPLRLPVVDGGAVAPQPRRPAPRRALRGLCLWARARQRLWRADRCRPSSARRFVADQAKKRALYGETYPIDEDFLAALDHGLPDVRRDRARLRSPGDAGDRCGGHRGGSVGAGPLRRRGRLMSVRRALAISHGLPNSTCTLADFVGGRPEPHHGATRHRGDNGVAQVRRHCLSVAIVCNRRGRRSDLHGRLSDAAGRALARCGRVTTN